MIKQLANLLHRQLLKVEWIRREVEAYRIEQENQRYHEDRARKMHSGNMVHIDDDMIADYHDTRMVGQRGVEPRIVRPFGMGRRK